ncbi:MAG: porphobilinogen synthase [Candidatus Eremiobacteraeota bacterium]|nr:porphobilinogen synthase [Candidatus Eremiobacteraeota bacterium]
MSFPTTRLRRLRKSLQLRKMVRETRLSPDQFIYPVFVSYGKNVMEEITSMPGIRRFSVDTLPRELQRVVEAGVPAVILFGIPEKKDSFGSGAYDPNGPVQQALKLIKKDFPEIIAITDVCLCQYTDHGHCGVVEGEKILNDKTLELLARTAVSHAVEGADVIAPSDMMDGRVGAIRKALDSEGFEDIALMSYSAKYASSFYGPFRDAANSVPSFGDRKSHQMDPPNRREAIREVEQDIEEGADIVMVKPALSYLDVIKEVRSRFPVPVAAYNVSGEYSMVKAASRNGWIDEREVVMEILTSIARAGADLILTYHALEAATWLRK